MIQYSKVIYNALRNKAGLVGEKIFPIIAPEETQYPFIVFERGGGNGNYTKDGLTNDSVNFTLWVLTTAYDTGIDMAEIVRNTFEKKTVVFQTLTLSNSELESCTEEFDGEAYIQKLTFKATFKTL